ncbi:uroporphyrinogen-III C-methyltransferase [Thalassotalea marina]|uniref:Heme biosynthesis operon protein HemX n=1 Tax=Thalassotalea marina TaxID=1673741 RepID=A0A919BHZ7_9GAMM|nr:uroporphyrinogen-III C-methyltransferase [Thalassotalea marina]GHF88778.1 heme biosynthesis operon protein HemX [Thalassotalea marina]
MTDNKKLSTSTSESPAETSQAATVEDTAKVNVKAKPSAHNAAPQPVKAQSSKSGLAATALFVSLLSMAGTAGLYYWQQMQDNEQSQQLLSEIAALKQQTNASVNQQLVAQQKALVAELNQAKAELEKVSQNELTRLQGQIQQLQQNKPTDWLLHEAEYLIRIAGRTLWLEKDTTAAMGLLRDADQRLQELNSPDVLPVRQLIRDDIAELELLPSLATEEITLTLMALSKQISQLQLSMVQLPDTNEPEADLTLSNDIADWRENLQKTWQQFAENFITVRRRAGNVEPLMSPEHQQNLRENLALKLQQAQWAAAKGNSALYIATLDDAQAWLSQYFSLEHVQTGNFFDSLAKLKNEIIEVQYPTSLKALPAIRAINEAKLERLPEKVEQLNQQDTNLEKNNQEAEATDTAKEVI